MSDEEHAALEAVEASLTAGERSESLATLAWLAGRELRFEVETLHGAQRRAVLLLAAGGDPRRGLALDGRAVTALATDLDEAARRAELTRQLERLRGEAGGLPLVCEALSELLDDQELAWRALACGLLAEELGE